MVIPLILILATIVPKAVSFSNTLPVVAWSSHGSLAIDRSAGSEHLHAATVLEGILLSDATCDYDLIVLVEHPGLHASDLRNISPASQFARLLRSAPTSHQFPYLESSSLSRGSFLNMAEIISKKCNHQLLKTLPDQDDTIRPGSKYFVLLGLPTLGSRGEERQGLMDEYESRISADFGAIMSAFPSHLVVYAGSPLSHMPRRQSPPLPLPSSQHASGGIFHRYQLLTPALITSLVVTFFVLVPVVFLGVYALASVQSPLKMDAPKGYNAHDKKTR